MVLSKDIKFAICFGLIIGAILSICNMCFAAEEEELSFIVVNDLSLNVNGFQSISGSKVGYISTEVGYMYRVVTTSASGPRYVCFSTELPSANTQAYSLRSVGGGDSFVFYGRDGYAFFDVNNPSGSIKVYRTKLEGMTGFVDNIAFSLSIGDLSQVWVLVVPILAISVLLGLGFYLLKRLFNRIKRAKGGV